MITASRLTKRYSTGLEALKDASFEIDEGEMIIISGPSGAGKTTLIRLIATLERPTSGSLIINGQNMSALRSAARPYVRRNFGVVFQDQKLLFDRSALENVLLPLDILGLPRRDAVRRAQAALDKVGLLDRERSLPVALSGGEQQRLAIARAVVHRPAVLIADEPTANLDHDSASGILAIFRDFHRVGATVLLASHDPDWSQRLGGRLLCVERGRVLNHPDALHLAHELDGRNTPPAEKAEIRHP